MANFENIKPYSDFSHEAALDGGVKEHLDKLKEASKAEGALEERQAFLAWIPVIAGASIGAWELCKVGVKKMKSWYRKYQQQLEEITDVEEKKVLDAVAVKLDRKEQR